MINDGFLIQLFFLCLVKLMPATPSRNRENIVGSGIPVGSLTVTVPSSKVSGRGAPINAVAAVPNGEPEAKISLVPAIRAVKSSEKMAVGKPGEMLNRDISSIKPIAPLPAPKPGATVGGNTPAPPGIKEGAANVKKSKVDGLLTAKVGSQVAPIGPAPSTAPA